jgi:hypothetical protein
MKCSLLVKVFAPLVAVVLVMPMGVGAAPSEPNPDPTFRDLRTDYVKTWHIYNDDQLDGILNPGDTEIATFNNWWTPASSHSQHNMSVDGGGFTYDLDSDVNSSPINFASHGGSGKENYWLGQTPVDENKNTIQFYMTYSQFDNNDWKGGYSYTSDPIAQAIIAQRHETRNGWALGWTSHSQEDGPFNPQTYAGFVDMDIFIHNGRGLNPAADGSIDGGSIVSGGAFGPSYSNPQVSVSNDISSKAIDIAGCAPSDLRYHPPVFDEATGQYSWTVNALRMLANDPTYNMSDLNDIINSMEIEEREALGLGAGDVVWGNRRPSEILANLVDHNGNAYTYDDAFLDNSFYHDGASDGGVVAGLAGESNYVPDPQGGNWGDQQVIRIDISQETLMSGDPNTCGNIEQIVIWDFGQSDSTTWDTTTGDQVNPTPIIFLVDMTQTIAHGQIYWDDGAGGRIYFPENRIYIAQVVISDIPEPASLTLLAMGAIGLLIRRRKAVIR